MPQFITGTSAKNLPSGPLAKSHVAANHSINLEASQLCGAFLYPRCRKRHHSRAFQKVEPENCRICWRTSRERLFCANRLNFLKGNRYENSDRAVLR